MIYLRKNKYLKNIGMMTGRTRNSFPYYTDFRRMVDCQFSCLSRRPLDLIEKILYSILDDIILNSHAVGKGRCAVIWLWYLFCEEP